MRTASAPNPETIRIPRADAYLVHLAQFSPPDPAATTPTTSTPEAVLGITGLLGTVPISPEIVGATPLRDPQARFNDRMTFAFGEFAVGRDALNSNRNPQFGIRHSDQDRQIIKAPGPNDDLDIVTPNPDVAFVDVVEPKFSPTLPTVKVPVPNSFLPRPTYGRLDPLRKAAATTLIADSLYHLLQAHRADAVRHRRPGRRHQRLPTLDQSAPPPRRIDQPAPSGRPDLRRDGRRSRPDGRRPARSLGPCSVRGCRGYPKTLVEDRRAMRARDFSLLAALLIPLAGCNSARPDRRRPSEALAVPPVESMRHPTRNGASCPTRCAGWPRRTRRASAVDGRIALIAVLVIRHQERTGNPRSSRCDIA